MDEIIVTAPDGVITQIRSPYNYDRDAISVATGLNCQDGTRTQQQFKDECDINNILKNFGITGQLPVTTVQPLQGDFTNIEGDYHLLLQQMHAAEENFMALPAAIREKFNHKAENFVDFCLNPDNIDAVRELGLAPRPDAPTLVQIVKENDNGNA